jgi:hypothetical protein
MITLVAEAAAGSRYAVAAYLHRIQKCEEMIYKVDSVLYKKRRLAWGRWSMHTQQLANDCLCS